MGRVINGFLNSDVLMWKKVIKYDDNQPLHGLFHLYRNSIDSFFRITSSSTYPNRDTITKILEEEGGNWLSLPEENSSFNIQFLRFPLKISSYTLRSRNNLHWNLPLEWKLEGSNNNETWNLLHYHPRNTDLIGLGIVKNYETAKPWEGYYHFFKVTQLGINGYTSNDDDHPNNSFVFSMNKVDFFGEILFSINTCMKRYASVYYSLFILFVL